MEVSRARRTDSPIAVLMLDIDHFKTFNDSQGHDAGDRVLQHVSKVLETTSRSGDVVCRYGGEEFVVVMPDATIEVASSRAEQIRQSVEASRVELPEGSASVTVSVGVAVWWRATTSWRDTLSTADAALYAAKEGGRNRVEVAACPRAADSLSGLASALRSEKPRDRT